MSKTLEYKGYSGSIEVSIEDACLYGKILFITDIVTFEAETPQELKKAFESAVDDYVITCEEIGKEPQKPFKGTFNIRISPELHREAAVAAQRNGISLNELTERAIQQYVHPSQPKITIEKHQHNHSHLHQHGAVKTGTFTDSFGIGEDAWSPKYIDIEAPKEKRVLKIDEIFNVAISITATGRRKEDNEIAFSVSCKSEGKYKIFTGPAGGIAAKDNGNVWSLATSQLLPVVASYMTDMFSKMGYGNIAVPPFLGRYAGFETPKKKRASKKAAE